MRLQQVEIICLQFLLIGENVFYLLLKVYDNAPMPTVKNIYILQTIFEPGELKLNLE